MKKVIYNQYGSIEDLQLVTVEPPTIKPNELLIRVKAVAINPLDWKKLEGQMKLITGSKFPKGIAFDFSGTVEKKGDLVAGFALGDAVFGALDAMKGEALAEFIVVTAPTIYHQPPGISSETAAAMVSVGAAALYMFQKAELPAGSQVLINGASGGVGLVALQMAKRKGLKVTAVATGDGLRYIQKWNPDHVIDYKKEHVAQRKAAYDAIFEVSGSLSFGKAKALMNPKAAFVSTLPNPVDLLRSFFNNIFASKKLHIIIAKPTQANYQELCDWVLGKELEITIARTFPMSAYKEAYRLARQGGIVGKVVITM
jgi:NADPH:quinone reductase-like Zn-dependent oxidoreductase